jgi:hypothetical protein
MYIPTLKWGRYLPHYIIVFSPVRYLIIAFSSIGSSAILLTPTALTLGYTSFFDFTTRMSVNDSLLGSYYFWWTNMLYLPLFFFGLASIFLLNRLAYWTHLQVLLVLVLLYVLYPLELSDYLISNYNYSILVSHSYGLNTLLTNILNKYHPLVFYVSVFLFFKYVLSMGSPVKLINSSFNAPESVARTGIVGWVSMFVNLTALWMGSWWALQEGTWGGWWNWDSSEMFGLLVTISLLGLTHSYMTLNSFTFAQLKSRQLCSLFVLSYFFIQLNFELVSHNFGSKFFFFFNNNLFFIEALFMLLTLSSFWHYTSKEIFAKTALYGYYPYGPSGIKAARLLTRFTVPLVLVVWMILSYKPLLNYFLWNFAQLNLFNSDVSWQHLNFLLAFIGLTWLSSWSSSTLLLMLASFTHVSHWLVISLLLFQISSRLRTSHTILVALLLTNLILFDVVTYRWTISTSWLPFYFDPSTVFISNTSTVLDNTAIEICQISSTPLMSIDTSWNISTLTNTPSLNFFSLLSVNGLFCNLYNLASTYAEAALFIELPLIPDLNLLFWLLLGVVQSYLFGLSPRSNF